MRRGVLVAAAGLIAISLAVIAYTQTTVTPVPIPEDPGGEIVGGFPVLGTQTVTVHWWGGIASTVVHFFVCSDPICSGPNSTRELASGRGPAGALTAHVSAAGVYEVNTSNGPPVNGSLQLTGLTSLSLLALLLLGTGIVLAAWSFRRRRAG